MRIAVNARILQAPRTGIGHYLVELLGALQAHADFEFSLFHGWGWSGDLPAAALPGYSRLSPWLRNLPGAYRARRWLEQRRFDSGRPPVDLYHEPSLWPLDFDGPMLMTLHDLTHLHYPATQPAARLREIERRLARGMEKARLILTDSQAIADEAQAYFGLPRERFVVAPLGHAARFRPRDRESLREPLRAHGLVPRGYFLCVGTLEPRKNLSLALRAHGQLPAAVRQRFPLMIVGMPGWESRSLAPGAGFGDGAAARLPAGRAGRRVDVGRSGAGLPLDLRRLRPACAGSHGQRHAGIAHATLRNAGGGRRGGQLY